MKTNYKNFLSLAFLLVLASCKTVGESSPFNFLERSKVQIDAPPHYVLKLSDCVLVLPVKAEKNLKPYQEALEASLLRHVAEKFNRAISASEVRKVIESNSLVVGWPKDQQTLRERMNCGTVVTGRLIGPGKQNLLVWSGYEVGIEITFPEVMAMGHIWQGRHVTSRSSGGIPLSPLGAVKDIAGAQLFALDNDVAASVIGDGVRRIMSRFPKVS